MNVVKIKIEGMTDLDCAANVLRILSAVPAVKSVNVALGEATVEVQDLGNDHLLQTLAATGKYRGEIIPPAPAMLIPQYKHAKAHSVGAVLKEFASALSV